jgi:hypothetical protein
MMAVPMQFTAANWPEKYGPRIFGVGPNPIIPPRRPLSPVQRSFPGMIQGRTRRERETKRQNQFLENYQRGCLCGFTSTELLALDAIAERPLQPSTLTNGILPIFRRDRWVTQANNPADFTPVPTMNNWVPLPNGIAGDWTASNNLVWNAIQPSLQIASRILMGSSVLPFVSLLTNQYVHIPGGLKK